MSRRQLQPCGTVAAYKRHRKAGEEACEACKEAARIRETNRRLARQAINTDEIPHGENGYNNYWCRCKICVAAHQRYSQGRRRQRRTRTGAAS